MLAFGQLKIIASLIFCFQVIIICFDSILSQPYIDLFNVRCGYFPKTVYLNNSEAKLQSYHITGELFLPLQFKNKDAFIIGASSDVIELNYFDPDIRLTESLYSVSLRLGYDKVFRKKEKWDVLVLFLPKINSDFEDLSSKDVQFGGLILSTYKKNESLKYKFGWYFNNEYFNPYTFPIIGIDWQVNKKWRLFGNLPVDFTAEYKMGSRFYSGFKFNPLTYSYRLNESLKNAYIKQVDYQLKLFMSCYFTSNLVAHLEVGHTLGRYFRQFGEEHIRELYNPVFNEFKDNFLFNIGFAFRAWTEEDKKPLVKSKK